MTNQDKLGHNWGRSKAIKDSFTTKGTNYVKQAFEFDKANGKTNWQVCLKWMNQA